MFHNKELRTGLITLALTTAVLTLAALGIRAAAGLLVLGMGLAATVVYWLTEYYRYRKLQKLSSDLDNLLVSGTPLPIGEYEEGELSILANQIQKMTLRLTESAEAVKAEKLFLADSLADISHQLRTPLTAMHLTAAFLSATDLPEERRMQLIGELRSLLSRTQWLVESLLKLSKLDAGTVRLAPQQLTLCQLAKKAAQPFTIPMELRGQRLEIRGSGNVTADPVWTAEALGNILKNSMEHTPVGGTITVSLEETALYSGIVVQDTGPGFDSKDIPHLFERFYKGAGAEESSCGIGLALAKSVITAQNGTIQAQNTPTGACFTIRFYKQVI